MTITDSQSAISADTTPKNWAKIDTFSSDDVIAAYEQGKDDQKKTFKQQQTKRFIENLNKATSISERLISSLNEEIRIHFKRVLLKANSMNNFETLFILDEKKFLSREFLNAYTMSNKLKKENNLDGFYIGFKFMPINSVSELNKARLFADGFFLQYGKKNTKKSSTRSA